METLRYSIKYEIAMLKTFENHHVPANSYNCYLAHPTLPAIDNVRRLLGNKKTDCQSISEFNNTKSGRKKENEKQYFYYAACILLMRFFKILHRIEVSNL